MAIALVLVETVAHDHVSSTDVERSQQHGCIVCTGALDHTGQAPAPEPSALIVSDVAARPPAPAVPSPLNPHHSGNAPPSLPLA
ncbi:MAG: hypothetical protein QM765_05885 [Myxococcales bacterium]